MSDLRKTIQDAKADRMTPEQHAERLELMLLALAILAGHCKTPPAIMGARKLGVKCCEVQRN